jgi:hypothetical protein
VFGDSLLDNSDPFRRPSDGEIQLVDSLLGATFPGREALVQQWLSAEVRRIDEDGSLQIRTHGGPPADVVRRIPVEAELEDEDGMTIHLLLHVVEGLLDELEIYRNDSQPVQSEILPGTLRLIVL